MESSCMFYMVSSSSRPAQASLHSDTAFLEGGRKPHGLLRPRHKSHTMPLLPVTFCQSKSESQHRNKGWENIFHCLMKGVAKLHCTNVTPCMRLASPILVVSHLSTDE